MRLIEEFSNVNNLIQDRFAQQAKSHFYCNPQDSNFNLEFINEKDNETDNDNNLELRKQLFYFLYSVIEKDKELNYIRKELLDGTKEIKVEKDELNITFLSSLQRLLLALYVHLYCYLAFDDITNLDLLVSFRKNLNISDEFVDSFLQSTKEINWNELLQDQVPIKLIINPPQKVTDWGLNIIFNMDKSGHFISKVDLDNLKAESYEHKLDREALKTLKDTPGIEKVMRKFHKYGIDKVLKVRFTGSNIRINESNFPHIYKSFKMTCKGLNLNKIPKLYIKQDLSINAFTTGVEDPIVVLNSGCIEMLSYDELLFILGHEVGHIKSEHILYHQIANILPILGDVIGSATLGFGNLISTSLQATLLNWQRKSEFTADRAGLLNCQNIDSAITAMMKLAGVPPSYYNRLNPEDFIEQAKEFEGFDEDNLDKIAKNLSVMFADHPWTVMRAAELQKWFKTGQYKAFINPDSNDKPLEKSNKNNFCIQCGVKLNGHEQFCTNCGTKLV